MSRKTRKWILVLVLVPVAAYGAAKLAIWYSVKDWVETTRESLAPFASLEYARILSPVFGAFGATGLRIKPHIFDDEISIGSVLVHIDDPVEKYHFLRAAMQDTVPTSFNFSLNGIHVPLTGDFGAWASLAAPSASPAAGPPAACETGAGFTFADLKKMGYRELLGNIVVDYAYNRRDRVLEAFLRLDIRDMFELTLEGRIPSSEIDFTSERLGRIPRFSDLTLTLQDSSWSSRFNAYCADAMGISGEQYVQERLKATRDAFLEAGFEPSRELMNGLDKIARGKAPLTLSLNPREPLDVAGLDTSQGPEFLIDQLGIEVMVEGKPIEDLGAARKVAVDDSEQTAEQFDETFKPTSIDKLPQFLKRSVQIFTADGKVHEGYLDSIDMDKIVLTRHLVGGSVTFDVGRSEVEKVLVLRP